MSDLHIILHCLPREIDELDRIVNHLKRSSHFLDDNRKQLAYKVFNNFRIDHGVPKGIRLTYLGNELLKRQFTAYEYDHNVNPTPKMYLILDQQMKWPYYFTKKKMVFYDQEDSAWFKINGSDISAFIDVI